LSSKAPVGYIDLRVFAHATEDPESVDSLVFKRSSLTGHHGNPIVLFEARVKERRSVQTVFAKLCSGLGLMDKQALADEITRHLDRGNLYLRLDKQSAFLGELRLGSVDLVHVRVHFKRHGTDEVVGVCREFGLLP
jgi:RNA binding exosome subunit